MALQWVEHPRGLHFTAWVDSQIEEIHQKSRKGGASCAKQRHSSGAKPPALVTAWRPTDSTRQVQGELDLVRQSKRHATHERRMGTRTAAARATGKTGRADGHRLLSAATCGSAQHIPPPHSSRAPSYDGEAHYKQGAWDGFALTQGPQAQANYNHQHKHQASTRKNRLQACMFEGRSRQCHGYPNPLSDFRWQQQQALCWS